MSALRDASLGRMWLLLGTLGLLATVNAASAGAGARPFRPPAVEPVGFLAPLVQAAGGEWDPDVLRAAAVIAGLLVALAAVALLLRPRPWPRWACTGLTVLVCGLLVLPGVALQAGLRQATAPWFHTNDSTYQIELGGALVRAGEDPYGHDYRASGLERFYTRDGSVSERVRERQVALLHFAYFPATPVTAAAWGLLPPPLSDYRFLVALCTLGMLGAALLFPGPLALRLGLGALLAANPIAVKAVWFGQADAPALLALLLAFAFAVRGRPWAAGALLAAAVLLKQFALAALPFAAILLFRRAGLPALRRAGIAFVAVAAVIVLPFLVADPAALWADTVRYGGSIYRIIGYGLAPLLLKAGILDDRHGYWPFLPLALLVWVPVTVLLARAQLRARSAWVAGAGLAASLYVLFFISRVFQETYVIWPLTGIALAGLLAMAAGQADGRDVADTAGPEP